MADVQLLKKKKAWYRQVWGKVLIGFIIVLLFFLPIFLWQTYKIYRQIKSGTYVPSDIVKEKAPYDMDKLVDEMSPMVGNKAAKIRLVEFGDFNCSRCLSAFPIVREMIAKYQDKILFTWRNYPVVKESSLDFAKAAVCANKQGKFWVFHDRMFQMQGKVTIGNLDGVALGVGLNLNSFKTCLQEKLTLAQLRKDYFAAVDGEVKGTPTFFINGFKIEGAIPFEMWDEYVGKFISLYGKGDGN